MARMCYLLSRHWQIVPPIVDSSIATIVPSEATNANSARESEKSRTVSAHQAPPSKGLPFDQRRVSPVGPTASTQLPLEPMVPAVHETPCGLVRPRRMLVVDPNRAEGKADILNDVFNNGKASDADTDQTANKFEELFILTKYFTV